jgi:hypothetical protein
MKNPTIQRDLNGFKKGQVKLSFNDHEAVRIAGQPVLHSGVVMERGILFAMHVGCIIEYMELFECQNLLGSGNAGCPRNYWVQIQQETPE